MMQVIGYIVGFMGFFILLGTAGADCDGKCMENSALMMVGTYFVMKGE